MAAGQADGAGRGKRRTRALAAMQGGAERGRAGGPAPSHRSDSAGSDFVLAASLLRASPLPSSPRALSRRNARPRTRCGGVPFPILVGRDENAAAGQNSTKLNAARARDHGDRRSPHASSLSLESRWRKPSRHPAPSPLAASERSLPARRRDRIVEQSLDLAATARARRRPRALGSAPIPRCSC